MGRQRRCRDGHRHRRGDRRATQLRVSATRSSPWPRWTASFWSRSTRGERTTDRIDALGGKVAGVVVPIYQLSNDNHPDPAVAPANPFVFQAERTTCAPLLGYPDAPPPRGQMLVPEAAAALPALSPDRRTYTFMVRKGWRFAPPSDAPLDAETFRFSIERALSSKLGSQAPGIGVLSDLVGARDFHRRPGRPRGGNTRPRRSHLLHARATLSRLPRAARAAVLLPGTAEDAHHRAAASQFFAPPGAGPYTFSGSLVNGEYAILKRNPNYRRPPPATLRRNRFPRGNRHGDGRRAGRARPLGRTRALRPASRPGRRSLAARWSREPPWECRLPLIPAPADLLPCAERGPTTRSRTRGFAGRSRWRLTDAASAALWNQARLDLAPPAGPGALRGAPTDMEPTARILPPGMRGGRSGPVRDLRTSRARGGSPARGMPRYGWPSRPTRRVAASSRVAYARRSLRSASTSGRCP